MAALELAILGETPSGLDLSPTEAVFAAFVSSGLELPSGTINLAFVDDERMQELNLEYSGNDYPTDVLSFSYIEDGGEAIEGVVGEMVISLETAARQAEAAGIDLSEEVALLALHGSLHIVGYDHQTPEEQDSLGQLQKEIMTAAAVQHREFAWDDEN